MVSVCVIHEPSGLLFTCKSNTSITTINSDTVQAIQGIDPYIELEDGEAVRSFPQGGSNLPSFAICAVRKV